MRLTRRAPHLLTLPMVSALLIALVGLTVPAEATPPGAAGKIVFIDTPAGTTGGKIATINGDGTGYHVIFDNPGGWFLRCPTWSPDGQTIAFSTSNILDIYLIKADGSDIAPGTKYIALGGNGAGTTDEESCPSWSPDGQRLAFYSRRGSGTPYAITLYRLSDGNIASIPATAGTHFISEFRIAWSPDGGAVVYLEDHDTGACFRNTSLAGASHLVQCSAYNETSWSPDGTKLALASGLLSTCDPAKESSQTCTFISPSPSSAYHPTWSPDGRYIAVQIGTDTAEGKLKRVDYLDPAHPAFTYDATTAARDPEWYAIPVFCKKKRATLVGTEGSDTLTGTPGDDVIVGLGGKDVIKGKGGNDTICGGKGADKLVGGAGDDKLKGDTGADTFLGGDGNDRLNAIDGGVDLLLDGGAGSDTVTRDANDPTPVNVP